LIPLNKVYPALPKIEEFRPIAVLSCAVKWLESRFKESLQAYVNTQIDPDQVGFVSKCSTNMNTLQLLQHMKKFGAKQKIATLFVDLKSAKNTVTREVLFEILTQKKKHP
jgi:hypothetical protein